jgi:hypothetical protein
MQKCFYHGKTDAVTVCIGCKMPVCQTCKDEGQKGFCEGCLKKVAKLGDRVSDMKKTGFANADQKATVMKTAQRAPGRDTKYCFHHLDILANGACVTCKRPFCPACLNTLGICNHCTQHSEAAQAIINRPSDRARALAEPDIEPIAKRDPKKVALIVLAGVVVGVVGGLGLLHKPADRARSQTAETLDKLKKNELTPQERALMAKLNQEAKTAQSIEEAPAAAPADTGGREAAVYIPASAGGGRSSAGRPAHAAPLRIRVAVPAVVSGMATVRARVSGTPDRVEFSVDGQMAGVSNSAPFDFEWESSGVSNGRHRITAVAYGEDGRTAAGGASCTVRN